MSTTRRGRHFGPPVFKGAGRPDTTRRRGALPAAGPYLRLSRFQDGQAVKQKKITLPRPRPTRLRTPLTLPSTATRPDRLTHVQVPFTWNLSPLDLQSSHLNICYYHQDLHRRPLRPGFGARFRGSRPALPTHRGLAVARRRVSASVGHRNPAFGSSRIASSAYQNGPLGALDSVAAQRSSRDRPYLFKNFAAPGSSYPEGNFGGNQLLDGSISLSPYTQVRRAICRRYRCGPPPEFPLAARSGIVHHLSGPGRRVEWEASWPAPRARRCHEGTSREVVAPPSSVREATYPLAGSSAGLGVAPVTSVGRRLEVGGGPALAVPRSDRAHRRPHPLPSRQFQALFDSLFKVLFIFPSRYLFAIGLARYLALGRNLPPYLGCIPKQPDSPTTPRSATGSGHNGAVTLSGAPFHGTCARSVAKDASADYNSNGENRSILILGSSRPPVREATAGRGPLEPGPRDDLSHATGAWEGGATTSSCEGALGAKCFSANLARGARATNLLRPDDPPARRQRWGSRARGGENTSGVTPRQVTVFEVGRHGHASWGPPRASSLNSTVAPEWLFVCSRPGPSRAADAEPVGAGREREARGFDGRFAPGRAPVAAGHRVQLVRLGRARFVESTMILPQVQWTSRNVIGGEPPTSPRSEHFTGPFNRQIAPPTKNGHAPPPIESRKSSHCQSLLCPDLACFEHSNFFKVTAPRHDPPVKARSASPVEGTKSTCAHRRADRSTQPKTATQQHADAKSASRPGQGHRRSSKSWAIGLVCESNQVHRDCRRFTWVHEHFRRRPAFSCTPGAETMPEGKVNATPIAPRPAPASTRVRRRLPHSGKTHKHQGMPGDPTRPREVRGSEGKTADETTAHTAGSTAHKMSNVHRHKMSNVHHSHRDARPQARCPARRWRSQQRRHRARDRQVKIGRGGTERSRESVKRSKTRSWAKGSLGPLGPFLSSEELKAIANGSEGLNGLCTARVRGKPLHRSAGATSPSSAPGRGGRQPFPESTPGGNRPRLIPPGLSALA
ncbi:hypothetical protein H6P81_015974 [Aristolochia fimbriata]|uniref:Uncharacterized protein n=1 Tax=Aristolochia fimbriata TaxID=158543 RepID=A0AAV7E7D1_ARIFI|nr:hypothetical protein H6P81_015974 [Aristolochia fimbriata]